jgi:integral membrane protein
MAGRATDLAVRVSLRAFQVFAIAEGGLLPAILLVAVIHWVSGGGAGVVAVVGALHGTAFTAYVLLAPLVARLLRWSPRTLSVALSVAFVPFAPWAFERRVRGDLTRCVVLHRRSVDRATDR